MKLVEPTTEYDQQICAYRKEFLDCGDSMDGTGALRRMDNPQVWIEHANQCKDPLTVPQGLVPATQYMLGAKIPLRFPRDWSRRHSICLFGKRIRKLSA